MSADVKKGLQKRLKAALQELEQLDARLRDKAEYGPGKGDPAIYDWELTLGRREATQARVENIRKALERCAEGRYGICQHCGVPIDPERLDALPLATLCMQCARLVRV